MEVARKVSDRIEAAMRFKLYSDQFASENYQTMNYGIGGTISGHVDSMGTPLIDHLDVDEYFDIAI